MTWREHIVINAAFYRDINISKLIKVLPGLTFDRRTNVYKKLKGDVQKGKEMANKVKNTEDPFVLLLLSFIHNCLFRIYDHLNIS